MDDPEIPYPSYFHDEVEQYILNLGLQLYHGNPKRIAFTDREKPFSNVNQPSANTKDVKHQMNTLVLRLSTEQPKTAHEARYAHPSFNIVDALTKLAKASIISLQLTSAGLLAKTWPKSRRTEQRRGSQDERSKIDSEALVTSFRAKPVESELPRAMSTSPKNRFLFDPEIPYPGHLHDEAKQAIPNLGLQFYCRNLRSVALTDREKLLSNANQPPANTKEFKYQLDILESRQSIGQPKTVQEVKYCTCIQPQQTLLLK